MTISSATRKAGPFLGNGVFTFFPFAFKVFQAADLQVIRTSVGVDTVLTLNSDYSVSLNPDQNATPGGTIIYPAGIGVNLVPGDKLTVTGVLSDLQQTHITNGGNFFANNIEDQMDYLTILVQQHSEKLNRVVIGSPSDLAPVLSIGTALQRANTFPSFDSNGNLSLSTILPSGTLSRASIGSFLYPITSLETAAIAAGNLAPVDFARPPGNVLRYGADPTGAVDSTAAFNAATASNATYSLFQILNEIVVPAGKYLINGTVYVRKGQKLRGVDGGVYIIGNNFGTGPTFKMGWGNLNGTTPTLDGGGQPVTLGNLFLVGGPSAGCIDLTNVAGAFLYDLFLSSPAVGISATSSSDVNLDNIIIDQGLTGIAISGCGNFQATLLKFFNVHFDLSIGANCYDCQWSNCHSEFNQFTSILLGDSVAGIYNQRFVDWTFTYNAQYATYTGAVQNRAIAPVVKFLGCSFNNMPGPAYQHGTNVGGTLEFENCTFDGLATAQAYIVAGDQSTKAAAMVIADENVRLVNCVFKNLPCNGGATQPITLSGATQSLLEMENCKYFNNAGGALVGISNSNAASLFKAANVQGDGNQFLCTLSQSAVLLSIRKCRDWFGPIQVSGGSNFVQFPYQFSNVWQICLRANQAPGAGANYRKSILIFLEKDNDNVTAVAKSLLVATTAVQGAANLNGAMSITAEFASVGGGTSVASSNAGAVALSWPSTYGSVSLDIDQIV